MATKFLTFDCYDTLVDYSTGKAASVRVMVREKGGSEIAAEEAVQIFEQTEENLQSSSAFRPLGEILRNALDAALSGLELPHDDADGERVVQSVRNARPFDDVAPALKQLRQHYQTALLSNSELGIITENITRIGVPFDQVVLAAEVGCYKPDPRMFQTLLERCQCQADEIVHVAQSFHHDIIPARELGWRCVWINRNGHDGDDAYAPYDELPDLSGLPALLGV